MSNSNRTAAKQIKDDVKELKNDASIAADSTIEKFKQGIQEKVETISERTGEYKEKVSENLLGAADKLHQTSDSAQEFLSDKTDAINEYAHQTIGKVNEIGHRAADVLAGSSDYLKNFDVAETRQQVKKSIKEKPELSIAIAGVFGLLIGLLIGRKSK